MASLRDFRGGPGYAPSGRRYAVIRGFRVLEDPGFQLNQSELELVALAHRARSDSLKRRPALRRMAPARARAAGVKQQLIDAAGGTYTTEDVARIIGIQRQAVTKRERNGQLLAVQGSAGQNLYPRRQFDANGVIPGFEELLEALPMENPWTRLSGLLAETPALAGRSILDVVRDGDLDEAIAVAQTLGEHGS